MVLCTLGAIVSLNMDIRVASLSNGFGPDWECTRVPTGDPVCVKRVKPTG
jgi:hypothetical protein